MSAKPLYPKQQHRKQLVELPMEIYKAKEHKWTEFLLCNINKSLQLFTKAQAEAQN
jgi:hypothetical protein